MSGALPMDLDYSFAPQPHALAADLAVSAGAYRTWGIIHMLKWNHIEPTPETIAEVMQVGRRSVFRWLAELEDGAWLQWHRHNPNPHRRVVLRTNTESSDAAKLAQIRALITAGNASLDEIRALLDNPGDGSDDQNTGGESATCGTSATGGTCDRGGTSATGGTCDRGGTFSDPTITESATGGTISDRGGTESATTITSPSDSSQPKAMNRGSSDHGGGGGDSSLSRKRIHHPHHTPRAPKNHTPTETERWLVGEGMGRAKAYQFRDLDLKLVQADSERRRGLGQGPGAWADAWEVAPPAAAAPFVPAAAPAASAYADALTQARQIAPADADEDEIEYLAHTLWMGDTEQQALDGLEARRWRAAHLPMPQPERIFRRDQ